jgi:intracellular septation protein A
MTAITSDASDLAPAAQSGPRQSGPRKSGHPLIVAGRELATDLLSSILFAGLLSVTHDVALSVGVSIAAGLGQIGWLTLRGRRADLMQWMSLGLVIVFGGASLMTDDPRFLMFKPTVIYCAIGAVMLRRGWMTRYMIPEALVWASDVVIVFGYIWSGMMFMTAALNLALVVNGDPKIWAWFLGVFPLASKLGLFAVQYLTTRFIAIRRAKAAGAFTPD